MFNYDEILLMKSDFQSFPILLEAFFFSFFLRFFMWKLIPISLLTKGVIFFSTKELKITIFMILCQDIYFNKDINLKFPLVINLCCLLEIFDVAVSMSNYCLLCCNLHFLRLVLLVYLLNRINVIKNSECTWIFHPHFIRKKNR